MLDTVGEGWLVGNISRNLSPIFHISVYCATSDSQTSQFSQETTAVHFFSGMVQYIDSPLSPTVRWNSLIPAALDVFVYPVVQHF